MTRQRTRHPDDTEAAAKRGRAVKAPAALSRLEHLFEDCVWSERQAWTTARKRARRHALDVLAGSSGAQQTHAALLVAAADLIGAQRLQLAVSPAEAKRMISQLEQDIGLPRIELAREVLRAPELLAMPAGEAARAQLGMLIAFAPLFGVSLWTSDRTGRAICACHVGERRPSRSAQQLAKRVLAGERIEPSARRVLLGIPVGFADQPVGALIGSANARERELCAVLMGEAVPMLAALLQRDILVADRAASEHALVEASERKLVRLGFDLHDGPIQDVAVLADDLRLFGDQLEPLLAPLEERSLVRGRIEDLEIQLTALDTGLRRLSGEVQAASVLLNQPFGAALRDRVGAFATRTGIRPRVTLAGEMRLLSTSQQIALLNIIQEALSNVREHAHASDVEITVSADEHGVRAQISDDGRGFDLESTRMRAAREGRIGLFAMNERVRLLGGDCRIETRPGGPTVVSVVLERWLPVTEEVDSRGTSRENR
jgi:signal transduction histidine kinase